MFISQVRYNPLIVTNSHIREVKHHGIYTLVYHDGSVKFMKPAITLELSSYPFCFTPCMIGFVEKLKKENKLC